MIEAVLGLHARDHEPVEARSGPAARIDDDSGGGIALERLLAVATLTPAQAALLITDVVDQFESAHRRGRCPTGLRGDAVKVSGTGQLTIECTGTGGSWDEAQDAVTGLIRQIATNCRGAALAVRVDESIAESSDPADLARRVRRTAATEFDPSEAERKRRQLAALVSAVQGRALPDKRETDPPDLPERPLPAIGPTLASNGWHPPAGKVWHRKRRRLSRRRGILALISVLILAGAAWAAPAAWAQLSRGWHTLLDPVESSMQDQISPVSPPPPVPEAAPPPVAPGATGPGPVDTALPGRAGPITQVTATFANGACEAGRTCTMRVDVGLDPGANVGAVTWNLTVYDRCTGVVQPGGDVTVPVPPGAGETYGIGSVALQPGTALAVAAVTTAPVAAASQPVYVPAENATCPPGDPHAGG
ncbi:hypothetical protein [Rhodococcus phenolicus]|uniref:hypothetical protein n=1 Tax=Rhodococcus phenolicus TaxID=263849 RepID=UPI00082BB2FF|nr:hypothetical protein [Rhodococcus phenolicus]